MQLVCIGVEEVREACEGLALQTLLLGVRSLAHAVMDWTDMPGALGLPRPSLLSSVPQEAGLRRLPHQPPSAPASSRGGPVGGAHGVRQRDGARKPRIFILPAPFLPSCSRLAVCPSGKCYCPLHLGVTTPSPPHSRQGELTASRVLHYLESACIL